MNSDNIFTKLVYILAGGLFILFVYYSLIGKYSIFNYFNHKNKLHTLTCNLKKKVKQKQFLYNETKLLSDTINIDLIEKEVIKNLKRVPPNYFLVIE